MYQTRYGWHKNYKFVTSTHRFPDIFTFPTNYIPDFNRLPIPLSDSVKQSDVEPTQPSAPLLGKKPVKSLSTTTSKEPVAGCSRNVVINQTQKHEKAAKGKNFFRIVHVTPTLFKPYTKMKYVHITYLVFQARTALAFSQAASRFNKCPKIKSLPSLLVIMTRWLLVVMQL